MVVKQSALAKSMLAVFDRHAARVRAEIARSIDEVDDKVEGIETSIMIMGNLLMVVWQAHDESLLADFCYKYQFYEPCHANGKMSFYVPLSTRELRDVKLSVCFDAHRAEFTIFQDGIHLFSTFDLIR